MSRVRRLAQNVSSGYFTVAAQTLFTLLSVPIALAYLSRAEWGLWGLVGQVVMYLSLVDLGITGAISRTLIDHKDRPHDGAYGSVIKTGTLVLVIQGLLIGALAAISIMVLPELLGLEPPHAGTFREVLLGFAVATAVFFPQRILGCILAAHQRFDLVNYAGAAGLLINLAGLWIGFRSGMGLWSLLVGHVAAGLFITLALGIALVRFKLLPRRDARGKLDGKVFRTLFTLGTDLFLLYVGGQLFFASQLVIVTKTLGLEAAAVWYTATKGFTLVQQFVWRLWDYSWSTVAEMYVRGERERMHCRFRDIFTLTASLSVVAGIVIAACNESALAIWTSGQIAWSPLNDALMALLFAVTSVTRLHVGLLGSTKKVQGMRYVYFLQGLSFVVLALLLSKLWGFPGIIASAVLLDLLWTGIYGSRRTAEEFGVTIREVVFGWIGPAARLALALMPIAFMCWWVLRPIPHSARLPITALVVGTAGVFLLWRIGFTPSLRIEAERALAKVRNRFGR